ncbi:MAG: WecB/TagA/CpsF family glycosyltransferase [Bacillota bacterium]|jgi:N-acetylglucosaminyldiphosphoundecaprenol N-acetyl-beta-D-mannosaminyltransferase|nr:WecB/TagA/CpsF family glycosyltransferase [Bacillota bacterium]
MDRVNIHGVNISNITIREAVEKIQEWISGNSIHSVYTPNAEIIMQAQRDPELKNILNNAGLLTPDGAGVVLASRILKTPLKSKVSGIDLVKNLFETFSGKNVGFYILGGRPGVAEIAAVNIMEKYGKVKIKGYHNGYFSPEEEDHVIDLINQSGTDILIVGLGAPKQEFWIHRNMYRLSCKVCIGVGGSIDIFAGKATLAPEIIRKLGFEWLYRLIREPRRYKRMMDLPRFIILTYKKRIFKK